MIRALFFILAVFAVSNAQVLSDPAALMQRTFGSKSVQSQNIILTDLQLKELSQSAQQKIDTKLYRIYLAKNEAKTLGYGVLLNKKVRTKTAIVLYLIDTEGKIKSIEIVAFNEPLEYLPSKTWLDVFDNKNTSDTLRLNQDIPTTTGATLSARAITDGARMALALIEITKR